MASFSSPSEDPITASISVRTPDIPVDVQGNVLSTNALDEYYDITRTAQIIVEGGYQRIALQFPDDLLPHSVPIYRRLKGLIEPAAGASEPSLQDGRCSSSKGSQNGCCTAEPASPSKASCCASSQPSAKTNCCSNSQPAAEATSCSNSQPTVETSCCKSMPLSSSRPQLYILADTSYGSCCIDEVAASHVSADLVVHYGYACLSQTSRLPVWYVFGKAPLDIDGCVASITSSVSPETGAVELILDTSCVHAGPQLLDALKLHFSGIYLNDRSAVKNSVALPATSRAPLHQNESTSRPTKIIYIGPSTSLFLSNLLLSTQSSTSPPSVYVHDPSAGSTVDASQGRETSRLLARRYMQMCKAKDSDVFGILVGTLGVSSYLPLITRLRSLLREHQKKSYTITVGKLNPSKLANFSEVECWILVACPENSVIDSKDFLRPIITPFELTLALSRDASWNMWEGGYQLKFEKLLGSSSLDASEGAASNGNAEDPYTSDEDAPQFSLITGAYRTAKKYGSSKDAVTPSAIGPAAETSTAVALRSEDNTVARVGLEDSAAAHHLQTRTYQGLDLRLGEDAPSVLEQGRSGIARGFVNEKELPA